MPDDTDGSAEAGHEETVVPIEDSGESEGDWSPFDEVQEDFVPRPIPRTIAADGMPAPNLPPPRSDIPALSEKTLVCMGDYSWFAIRDPFGEVVARFEAGEVDRAPDGRWRVRIELAIDRTKMLLERDRKRALDQIKDEALMVLVHSHASPQMIENASDRAMFVAMMANYANAGHVMQMTVDWVEVEPARPECAHYVRQMSQFDYNPENQKIYRLCSARRTTEGTFMTVSDRAVWACSMREPRDLVSEAEIDDFDARKMKEGASRVYLPMFGSGRGIFSGRENDG